MMALVDRALEDEQFRTQAQEDPEGAVAAAGFDLEEDELAAVKEYQTEIAGLSDEELQEALASGPRRQGG